MGARPLSDTSQGVLGDSLRATWSMGYGVIGGRGPQGPTSSIWPGLRTPPNHLGPGGPTLSSETGPKAPPYHQSQGPRPHLIIGGGAVLSRPFHRILALSRTVCRTVWPLREGS